MDPNEPIAVIGMSCRFPGDVRDPEALWQLCADGKNAWSEIPSSRFNLASVYHPNNERLSTVRIITIYLEIRASALTSCGNRPMLLAAIFWTKI